MKRITAIIAMIILFLALATDIYADEIDDYKAQIIASLEDTQGYGITVDNLSEIDSSFIFDHIAAIISNCIKAPSRIILIIIAFATVSRILETVSESKPYFADILIPVCLVAICPYILASFEDIISAMNSVQGFLLAYVPIFASVMVASGNPAAAISYNSILMYASSGATLAISLFIKPILGCMFVAVIIKAVNPEMPDIASTLRRLCVTLTGFIMCIFLGVIGLQGAIGGTGETLTVRAGKYLVSSFVPIIGGALNESHRTVSASLSSIRSTVGVFGIVIMLLIFATPIITAIVYKWTMTLCEMFCGLLSSHRIGEVARGIGEVYTLLSAIMTIYLMMLVISTGALIALGGVSV